MNEKVYINNIPLIEKGVILAKDSYKSLLQWSSLKSVKSNSWAEHNYIEPDLLNPTLDKRTVTLNFHAQGLEGYENFMEYLLNHSSHVWTFTELGITINLRVMQNRLSNVNKKWQSFSVDFIDDEPYTQDVAAIDNSVFGGGGFTLDDYTFDYFGVWILDGTLTGFRPIPKIKERLNINENSRDGNVYDTDGDVRIDSGDITIKCLIRGRNLIECVNNYYSLLNYIKRPKSRLIFVKSTMEMIECYYKSSVCNEVHKKLASGLAGIAFSITFVIIDKGVIETLSNDGQRFVLTDSQGNYLCG